MASVFFPLSSDQINSAGQQNALFPGTLTIVVVKARSLLNMEKLGTSDPYVKVRHNRPTKGQQEDKGTYLGSTPSIDSNLNPSWPEAKSCMETVINHLSDEDPYLNSFTFSVWDRNISKDQLMGSVILNLGEIFTRLLDEQKLGRGGNSISETNNSSANGALYTSFELDLQPGTEKSLQGKRLGVLTVKISYLPHTSDSSLHSSFASPILSGPISFNTSSKGQPHSSTPLDCETPQILGTRCLLSNPTAKQFTVESATAQIAQELDRRKRLSGSVGQIRADLETLHRRDSSLLSRQQALVLALLIQEACERKRTHLQGSYRLP